MNPQEKTKKIELVAKTRGKNKAKALIKKGFLPAIFYGPKVKTTALELKTQDAERVFKAAGTSRLIDLKIGDKKAAKVLIHDSQIDPVEDKLVHLDFYAVRMDRPIKAEIPVEYRGEPEAVKNLGGTLLISKDTVEVECLPQDLVDEFKVNLNKLKTFEDMIKLSDLDAPQGIEFLEDKDTVLALVQPPRSEEELAELEEKPIEDVEAVEVETGVPEESLVEEGGEKKEVAEREEPESKMPEAENIAENQDNEAKSAS